VQQINLRGRSRAASANGLPEEAGSALSKMCENWAMIRLQRHNLKIAGDLWKPFQKRGNVGADPGRRAIEEACIQTDPHDDSHG
jgi:hypothetical protein